MEPWEDELLPDDDFSDEEEAAEEQIEEPDLEMDEDGFADWAVFQKIVEERNRLDRNRERRERDHEKLRGDVPLEF